MMIRRTVSIILTALMALSIVSFSSYAANAVNDAVRVSVEADNAQYMDSGLSTMPKLSAYEIRKLLADNNEEMPPDDEIFEEYPSFKAPYKTGKVSEALLTKAANRLNALRAIAGVPAVSLDLKLSNEAQHGSVLLSVSDFSHTPEKPDDMDDDFYNIAFGATSTSNLYDGEPLLVTLAGFMDDSDNVNINKLGHRRWQLNPAMGKVGFGYASSDHGLYTTEKVFDRSGAGGPYDLIAWPSSGYFPDELFNENTAWSATLDPDKYTYSREDISVTLKSLSTGQTWNFSDESADGFFNVDKGGFGVANCIIFRPSAVGSYSGSYTVEITGIRLSGGNDATVRYRVDFFCAHAPEQKARAKSATCTQKGNIAYWQCSKCGKYFSDREALYEITLAETVTEPLGHDYMIKVTEPTCTEPGFTEHKCSRCGDYFKDGSKDPLGHEWGGWTVTKPATDTENGEEVRYCLHDQSHFKTRIIPKLGAAENPFGDVPAGSWFEKAAVWCASYGYITGTGEGTFSPGVSLTRAMFVQILVKVDGLSLDSLSYKGKFTDVKPSDWFAKAVQWAVDNKITGGTSDNTFSPNDRVTREQLAVFFYAYSKSMGYDVSATVDLNKYTDAKDISSWAVTAVKWAVAEGLISGMTDTTIGPKGSATRAQAAVIFKNYVEIYSAKQK
ncbi:MAG: S-layer homology domain-containing protein [Clostridia bacterium]|nr:S-layer homology domain-containing protein [Clostridia bacterium]